MAAENVKRGMVCATIGALSWGLSGTCGQYLFMHYTIDALLLTNIRMLGAGIVLMILVISLQRHTLTALLHNRRDLAQLAAFSVLGLVTCQLTYLSRPLADDRHLSGISRSFPHCHRWPDTDYGHLPSGTLLGHRRRYRLYSVHGPATQTNP